MADPSIPVGLFLEGILDFAPLQSDKESILDGATRLASSLMDASTRSTCKLASAHNSFALPLTADLTIKVPMTTLGMLLMDKAGRRPLLLVSAAGTCLGCFLVGLSFLSQDYQWAKDLNIILALTGILVYTGSFSLGMGGIPWVIMSEIFPINMKGSAGSLVTLVSWLGSWIVSYAFNFLMLWSSVGTFFLFASICGFTVLFVARLVPETKGRTLEDIQASMSSL